MESVLNPDPYNVIEDPPTDGAVAAGCGISYVYKSLADCQTLCHSKIDPDSMPAYGTTLRMSPPIDLCTEMVVNCSG